MPPNQLWYCTIANTTLFTTTLWSTLLIIVMTFERFYSIIMPHKAASFNTTKRAKITITCIVIFGTVYNIPHVFVSANQGRNCVAHTNESVIGQVYFWFSFVINFLFPFLSLLTMNGVIIHKIGNRSHLVSLRLLPFWFLCHQLLHVFCTPVLLAWGIHQKRMLILFFSKTLHRKHITQTLELTSFCMLYLDKSSEAI